MEVILSVDMLALVRTWHLLQAVCWLWRPSESSCWSCPSSWLPVGRAQPVEYREKESEMGALALIYQIIVEVKKDSSVYYTLTIPICTSMSEHSCLSLFSALLILTTGPKWGGAHTYVYLGSIACLPASVMFVPLSSISALMASSSAVV